MIPVPPLTLFDNATTTGGTTQYGAIFAFIIVILFVTVFIIGQLRKN